MAEKNKFSDIIKNMDPEEHKASIRRAEMNNASYTRKLDGKKKVREIAKVAKVLGIAEAFLSSGGTEENIAENSHTRSSDSRTFREGYRVPVPPHPRGFSVYDINEIDIANARDYYKGVDGKGDPKPHDCDHEH